MITASKRNLSFAWMLVSTLIVMGGNYAEAARHAPFQDGGEIPFVTNDSPIPELTPTPIDLSTDPELNPDLWGMVLPSGGSYLTLADINALKHGEIPRGFTRQEWVALIRQWKVEDAPTPQVEVRRARPVPKHQPHHSIKGAINGQRSNA
jgi:hypothetical protein